jgi:hypothetical protein
MRICAPIWTPFQNFRRRSQDGLDPSKGFPPEPCWHHPLIIAKLPFCIAKRPKDPGFGPLWDGPFSKIQGASIHAHGASCHPGSGRAFP